MASSFLAILLPRLLARLLTRFWARLLTRAFGQENTAYSSSGCKSTGTKHSVYSFTGTETGYPLTTTVPVETSYPLTTSHTVTRYLFATGYMGKLRLLPGCFSAITRHHRVGEGSGWVEILLSQASRIFLNDLGPGK